MTYKYQVNGQSQLWQIKINADKCAVLWCTHSVIPIATQYVYTVSAHNIDTKKLHTYLGVIITCHGHLTYKMISNRSTNFIKWNLNNCPPDNKRTA